MAHAFRRVGRDRDAPQRLAMGRPVRVWARGGKCRRLGLPRRKGQRDEDQPPGEDARESLDEIPRRSAHEESRDGEARCMKHTIEWTPQLASELGALLLAYRAHDRSHIEAAT